MRDFFYGTLGYAALFALSFVTLKVLQMSSVVTYAGIFIAYLFAWDFARHIYTKHIAK